MKGITSTILALALVLMFSRIRVVAAATASDPPGSGSIGVRTLLAAQDGMGMLPPPVVTDNSVELCLNSRYSQHSLRGTASAGQLSNVLWAAGRVPFTGTRRDLYVITPDATYSYDPNAHALNWQSDDVVDTGAFAIRYESELDFDTGVSFMPAMLASVSLCRSSESSMANCPKGLGYPKTRLYFGVQASADLTAELAVHSSIPEGEPGWLPDPCTAGENRLEEVLARLKTVDRFAPTSLTLPQISQILWAGYGCTPHTTTNGRAGLTVPSAWANYYLTRSIYIANEHGVYRYHNRKPDTNTTTRDHRIEQIESGRGGRAGPRPVDARGRLQSAVDDLPEAPCYALLCLDSSYVGQEYAQLEVGFVAGSMLIQATALDLGCHIKSDLTSDEQRSVQSAAGIPTSHIPQAVVSLGSAAVVAALLEGDANQDQVVDLDDYVILSVCWRTSEGQAEYELRADFNRDGTIDTADLSLLAANWLRILPPQPAP